MHHCLQIQEILERILESVYAAEPLAALARTCLSFSEPALDALWGNHGSLETLICLMHPDLLKLDENGRPLRFTRSLQPSDWAAFQRYCHRVRYIHVTSAVPLEVLREMHDNAPPDLAFSNIHQLCAFGSKPESLDYIHLFLGPRLRHLEVAIYSHPSIWEIQNTIWKVPRILHDLASRCPNLQHLDWDQDYLSPIAHPDFRHGMSKIMSEIVCRYDKLESLYIRQFDLAPGSIQHLLASPTLQLLQWKVDQANVHSPKPENHDAWSSLSVLHHWTTSLESFMSIIERTQPSLRLKTLQIHANGHPRASEILALSTVLPLRLCHKSFKDISINFFHPGPEDKSHRLGPHTLNLSHIEPLFSFHNLIRIKFTVRASYDGCILDLNDRDLQAMASAWPSLERMEFHLPQVDNPELTIDGLIALVANCPKLYWITIWLNFSIESLQFDDTALDKIAATRTNVMYLDVLSSPISNIPRTAGLLARVFPDIGKVSYDFGSPYDKEWEMVCKILTQSHSVNEGSGA